MSNLKQPDQATLALSGAVTVADAEALHAAAVALAEHPEVITVDLSGLHDIDLSGLQVLLALARARAEESLIFRGWPPAIRARIELCGLTALLQPEGARQ